MRRAARGGFGYDPYFWLPDLGMTAAELPPGGKEPPEPPRQAHARAARPQLARQRRVSAGAPAAGACMCTCPGACANARTAISIRIS